jgi:hypothetical protein
MTTQDHDTHHHPFEEFVSRETVEHLKAARHEIKQSVEAMFPPGFVAHKRAARKEVLLAARSFIDGVLQRMDQPDTGTTV